MALLNVEPFWAILAFSSLCRHLHIEATAVVAHESVIDAQKQSSSHVHSEGLTFADDGAPVGSGNRAKRCLSEGPAPAARSAVPKIS
jgi:hypothetical protein